ncbi:MAG: hypothetical protein ACMUIM_01950, partial [bacterium]
MKRFGQILVIFLVVLCLFSMFPTGCKAESPYSKSFQNYNQHFGSGFSFFSNFSFNNFFNYNYSNSFTCSGLWGGASSGYNAWNLPKALNYSYSYFPSYSMGGGF